MEQLNTRKKMKKAAMVKGMSMTKKSLELFQNIESILSTLRYFTFVSALYEGRLVKGDSNQS